MLTARQKRLLEIIIREFSDTAEAVGSIDLPDKYELTISPATIRNEMARLMDMGYLQKPHSSSGRVPTTLAFKYFLQDILDEFEDIDIKERAVFNEDLFQKRFNADHLMLSAVNALNELTSNASIALIEDKIFHAGLSELLDNPEFQDLEKFKSILSIIEDYSEMASILNRYRDKSEDVRILIGEETGSKILDNCAIVFVPITLYSNTSGFLAVFGPNRMNYRKVVPALKYISDKIEDILRDW
ncbi:MAG: hypothetical protein GF364_22200 [Candidatus Lokiarchaeota archaeon]|nr:hypothetical protein [Candidatus Lokiarchaeota archaeon]